METLTGVILVILFIIMYSYVIQPAAQPVVQVAAVPAGPVIAVVSEAVMDTSGYAVGDEYKPENFSTGDIGGMLLQLPSQAKAGVVGFSNTLQRRFGMGSAAENMDIAKGTMQSGYANSAVLPY